MAEPKKWEPCFPSPGETVRVIGAFDDDPNHWVGEVVVVGPETKRLHESST